MKTMQPDTLPLVPRRWLTLTSAVLALVCFGWLLGGCLPTGVQPFYRVSDVIQDPALLGTWKDKPDGTTG